VSDKAIANNSMIQTEILSDEANTERLLKEEEVKKRRIVEECESENYGDGTERKAG
jgi:hypothetical protein